MAKTISFLNHKGGVAKTTSTSIIGSLMAAGGKRILLVDLDAQANLTQCHLTDRLDRADAQTIYTALRDRQTLPIYDVKERDDEVFDLVPSNSAMAKIESVMATVTLGREHVLKKLLSSVQDDYDYIIIDCPPSLGIVASMALTASDYVVIPMTPDVLSYFGLELLMDTIHEVQEISNPSLKILGLFYTKYDTRKNVTNAVEWTANENLKAAGIKVFARKIGVDTKIESAPLKHRSLLSQVGSNKTTQSYYGLVGEMLEAMSDPQANQWRENNVDKVWPENKLLVNM